MLGVLYIEDQMGEVYPVEVDLTTMMVKGNSRSETFGEARARIFSVIQAKKKRLRLGRMSIRIASCLPSNARSNIYSCFRCSGCHRPLQASRSQTVDRKPRKLAASFACLYHCLEPLNTTPELGDSKCWFGGECKTDIKQDS